MPEPRNWTLNDYSVSEWTTLVTAPATIRAIIIANTSASDVGVSARISNGADDERAIIIPEVEVKAGESTVVDLCTLCLGRNDELQFQADDEGIHITASGEAL